MVYLVYTVQETVNYKKYKEKDMLDTLSPDTLICVFCEGIVAEKIDYTKSQYCIPCHEYKGVTTVAEYKELWS
jgi:hypothetical protein